RIGRDRREGGDGQTVDVLPRADGRDGDSGGKVAQGIPEVFRRDRHGISDSRVGARPLSLETLSHTGGRRARWRSLPQKRVSKRPPGADAAREPTIGWSNKSTRPHPHVPPSLLELRPGPREPPAAGGRARGVAAGGRALRALRPRRDLAAGAAGGLAQVDARPGRGGG